MAVSFIGPDVGDDYADIGSWESDTDNVLTEIETAAIRSGYVTTDATNIEMDGATTTASFYREIISESGFSVKGKIGGNVNLRWRESYVRLRDIEVNSLSNNWDSGLVGFLVERVNLLGVGNPDACYNSGGSGSNSSEVTFDSCLFRNGNEYGIRVDGPSSVTLRNCTVADCNVSDTNFRGGIVTSNASATITAYNTNSVNNNRNDWLNSSGTHTGSHNTSNNGSHPGTNGLSIVSADNFTNPGAGDYTVKDTDADIYQSGTAAQSPATDLVGTSYASTPSRGCYEFVSAPPSGRIMSSLAGAGGLVGDGGIAGKGGGLAGHETRRIAA